MSKLDDSKNSLAGEIYDHALQCGFDNCGIISVEDIAGFNELYAKRLSNVPESRPFYDRGINLLGTKEQFPWAKSIVILTYEYGKFRYPEELRGRYAKSFFLEPVADSTQGYNAIKFEKWFADRGIRIDGGADPKRGSIGPLRYFAVKAGLGIFRKNNFFYTENGSYVSLIGYMIDSECELIHHTAVKACSEKCNLCSNACKTKALRGPYAFNPLKCVSFWTTFGNCSIPEGLDADMFEEWTIGCDNCQDVCPHNRRHDWNSGKAFSNLDEIAAKILPENYDNLSDEYLVEQVISKSADHLQTSHIPALRKNAKRASDYKRNHKL